MKFTVSHCYEHNNTFVAGSECPMCSCLAQARRDVEAAEQAVIEQAKRDTREYEDCGYRGCRHSVCRTLRLLASLDAAKARRVELEGVDPNA